MLKRLWLLFAQIVTALLAILFVLSTLKPEWLSSSPFEGLSQGIGNVTIREAGFDRGSTNPGSYHEAVKRSMPAVVNIFTSKKVDKRNSKTPQPNDPWFKFFFGDPVPERQELFSSLGSGVIVSSEGIILTNHHVIEGADQIEVALADGRKTKATVIGRDTDTDIAVLKISLTNLPTPITLASSESVQVGDVVLAIGNPFGVGQTVTSGIVSALGRNHLGINTFENFIQTDAAINPGNSGGALVDTRGNLIGINTAIYSRSGGSIGIGFAIPVSTAKQVMESLIKQGSVTRGWIGIEPQDITSEIAATLQIGTDGILIAGVLENGPADKAGIKPGDVLRKVDERKINDTAQLLNYVTQVKPGEKMKVQISRNGKNLEIDIFVGKRPTLNNPLKK